MKKIVTIAIEEEAHKQAKKLCIDKNITLSEFITSAVLGELERQQ